MPRPKKSNFEKINIILDELLPALKEINKISRQHLKELKKQLKKAQPKKPGRPKKNVNI